jgi:glycogen debranching enzyme
MDYLVVSDNHTFMISQYDGDVPLGETALGLYYFDTRHLSAFELRLNGRRLDLLTSSDEEVYRATMLLTNESASSAGDDSGRLGPQTIGVSRTRVVSGAIIERIMVTNYARTAVALVLTADLAADFADIFLVRGYASGTRGTLEPVRRDGDQFVFAYHGADDITRTSTVGTSRTPDAFDTPAAETPPLAEGPQGEGATRLRQLPVPARARLSWTLNLVPQATEIIDITITPSTSHPDKQLDSSGLTLDAAIDQVRASYRAWDADTTRVTSDNPVFDQFIQRSSHDLRALSATFDGQRMPVAGIPWFAVPFGRDSLIASFQALAFQPELAKGTLRYLAAHQGTSDNPWRDEHPGKILHEMRFGELANTDTVPFNPYYGSIDSTLLFLMLFAETIHWTGDEALYHELLPAVLRAIEWIDRYADLDGDGYIEFQARSEGGLRIQGWKDSGDSVLRPDGTLAEPPLALVEVQAYVYAAKQWIGALMERMGQTDHGARMQAEAVALKERFNQDFWLEADSTFAQAIELGKGPLRELTSNPGHAFLCGIVAPDHASQLAARLVAPDMASGWGIRTRGASDPNYNPMSYHNGSVWPHDNSLTIAGLARSGFRSEANQIASEIFAAAQHFRLNRLPELLCGYERAAGTNDGPAPYPVSCRPQAWAAGTGLLIVQSILGLEARALDNTLRVAPQLPPWLERVEIQNLRVGERRVHLRVTNTGVEVVDDGGVRIEVA